MTKLIVTFRNSENAPKNMSLKHKIIIPKIFVTDCIVIKGIMLETTMPQGSKYFLYKVAYNLHP